MTGNNPLVFFGGFIHSQKRVPATNLRSPTDMWNFWSLSPESLHPVTIPLSGCGKPGGFRHTHGFSGRTCSPIDANNERFYRKWNLLTLQGTKNLTAARAEEPAGVGQDYATRDLHNAIARGDFPTWRLCIQIMPEAHAGTPGAGYSPDKVPQARPIGDPDAHRCRLGTYFGTLPVNRAHCPVHTCNRDRPMHADENGGDGPNYEPDSFAEPVQHPRYRELPYKVCGDTNRYNQNAGNEDDRPPATCRPMPPVAWVWPKPSH
jgi:catalase